MITKLILFGATGDLAGRFLLPALAELQAAGALPEGFQVVGAGRQEMESAAFRRFALERLDRHAVTVSAEVRNRLAHSLSYGRVDLGAPDASASVARLLGEAAVGAGRANEPVAAYLALPPAFFVPAVTALGEAGLPPGSRIVVEKPFGENLESAIELNRLLARVSGGAGERAVFRVDHILGMATVHNLLGVRLANRVLEPVWNSAHIERIDILWEETLALEGRAAYFDRAGTLKDVMQNHLLQILALVAMEPPASLGEGDLRSRKADVLRTVRAPAAGQMASRTRRARYTAGRLAEAGGADGSVVPAYAQEEGVDSARGTETFGEVVLELDSWRWAGTRFVLRAGKALQRRQKGVVMHFRPVPHLPFGGDSVQPAPNELRIGLDGPESFSLHLTGTAPGPPPRLAPLTLTAPLPEAELHAYSHVLLEVLTGDSTLSIRGDEAEQAWRIMTPVLKAWEEGRVPLEEYPAGSPGPPPAESAGRTRL